MKKISDRRKRKVIVIQKGNSVEYDSLKEAADAPGIASNRICVSCKYGVVVSSKYQFKYK